MAVQKAKKQGFSLRAIPRKLGIGRMTGINYSRVNSILTRRFSAKELGKAQALTASSIKANQPGVTFPLTTGGDIIADQQHPASTFLLRP